MTDTCLVDNTTDNIDDFDQIGDVEDMTNKLRKLIEACTISSSELIKTIHELLDYPMLAALADNLNCDIDKINIMDATINSHGMLVFACNVVYDDNNHIPKNVQVIVSPSESNPLSISFVISIPIYIAVTTYDNNDSVIKKTLETLYNEVMKRDDITKLNVSGDEFNQIMIYQSINYNKREQN